MCSGLFQLTDCTSPSNTKHEDSHRNCPTTFRPVNRCIFGSKDIGYGTRRNLEPLGVDILLRFQTHFDEVLEYFELILLYQQIPRVVAIRIVR